MKDKLLIEFLIAAIVFTFSACQKSEANNINISPSTTFTPSQKPVSISSSALDSPIRKVDFKNFTYPWTEGLSSKFEKTFTLKNGEIPYEHRSQMGVYLGKIEYADVTNDSLEEAILTISLQTGGSAMPNIIYIYSLENEKPKLLWSFDTGDRAEGGLKKVYVEDGDLVVELFGENKLINNKWETNIPEGNNKGLFCPVSYTKTKLNWNGNNFVVKGEREILVYSSES